MFIGVYDYTVLLTYLSLISSIFGMIQALNGNFTTAIFALAFSGVCDAFDGRVARTKKDRTEDEKNFGIQLDSLCDVICFGLFPAMICYLLGLKGIIGCTIISFYCLCAVIRLAFFNVMEANRQKTEGGCAKIYRGLPVTSISLILPLSFWMQFLIPASVFPVLLHFVLLITGFLFILDFKLRKPGLKTILTLMGITAVIIGVIFTYTKITASKNIQTTKTSFTGELYETKIA